MDNALLRPHQPVHKGLPSPHRLDFIEETMDCFTALLLGIQGVIGLHNEAYIVLPETMKTVIEEVQIKDVLPGNSPADEAFYGLEEKGGLSTPPHANAHGGLVPDRLHLQTAGHAGVQAHFLKIEQE